MVNSTVKKIILIILSLGIIGGIILSIRLRQQSDFLARPNPTPKNQITDSTLPVVDSTPLDIKNTNTISSSTPPYLTNNNKIISLEIADTPQKQEQGLSGRTGLSENEAMLFVFDQSSYWSFWMKDMYFPIDMIWLDSDFKVVYIKENADPKRYPESYTNTLPALYVLETKQGFVKEQGIKKGDHLDFTLSN